MRIAFNLILAFGVAAIVAILLNGCSTDPQGNNTVKVCGAGDLYYLGAVIGSGSPLDTAGPAVQINLSEDSINQLKRGKTDAVLLGREPTADELKGLQDYVIAYDAVCMIIDQNSYVGGNYLGNGYITIKNSGLRNLTTDDLTGIFSTAAGTAWPWNGEYYVKNPLIDPGSWLFTRAGKFDTQSVIYNALGLDERAITASNGNYLDPTLHLEEEVISFEYKDQTYPSNQSASPNFIFKLGFASRRVMTIAPQHDAVSVVSVDGINPLENPQSVYDGSYKFSRKIHLLIRNDSPASAMNLVNFLQSQAGQKLIANAGYLPIIKGK
jgi:ABC-type phosphate transport system substrate-binding protein